MSMSILNNFITIRTLQAHESVGSFLFMVVFVSSAVQFRDYPRLVLGDCIIFDSRP